MGVKKFKYLGGLKSALDLTVGNVYEVEEMQGGSLFFIVDDWLVQKYDDMEGVKKNGRNLKMQILAQDLLDEKYFIEVENKMEKLVELIKNVEQWSKNKGHEDYKVIDGFPHYVITNKGELVRLSYIDLNGRKRKSIIVKQRINSDGYPCVKLTHFGKKLTTRVHRLVAECFLSNEDNKETVNHKDGNKNNNNVENLEWSTRSEQMYHAYENDLKVYSKNAKIKSKLKNGKPVKITFKENNREKYYLTASDCSIDLGYSKRWADKVISSMGGETKKFKVEYVNLEELKNNTSKLNIKTLIELIEIWSYEKGLHLSDPIKQYLKVSEECSEIAAGLARNDLSAIEDGIGDTIVTLVILSQQLGLSLEACLETAYDEIKGRTGKMIGGVFVKSEDLK